MSEHARASTAQQVAASRNDIHAYVKQIGKSGDLDLILAAERNFLQNDLDRHSTSPGMASSLKIALSGMAIAEKHIVMVRNPAAYRVIDEGHSLPKNRIGGVPKDEARQFFSSHATRLLNLDRSRLSPEEKLLLDQRKTNMRTATGLYETLQRDALGLPPKEQGRSRTKGMER
jgi:hypothetical protein